MNFPWIVLLFPAPGTDGQIEFDVFAVTESKDCAGTNTPRGPLNFRLAEDGKRVVYQLGMETGVIGIGDMPRLIAEDLTLTCHETFAKAKAWAKAKCDGDNADLTGYQLTQQAGPSSTRH